MTKMIADNPPDSQSLLESVIGLTEQRDQEALESSLIGTLRELTAATRVALYSLPAGGDGSLLTLSHYAQAPEQSHAVPSPPASIPLAVALQDAARVFQQRLEKEETSDKQPTDDAGVSISYPVIGAGEQLTGVLVVSYPALSSSDHRLIGAFLRIYQNYQALLNESQRDRLTGLLNRKTFDDQINRILAEQRTAHHRSEDVGAYSLAIFDIDHFKRINDTYGHLYGDEVLLLFARIMTQTFRNQDLLFRFGGEEFVALIKTPDIGSCMRTLERFRANVENYAFPQVGRVTVSGGCVGISGEGLPTTLIDHADQALYYSKNNGRNQVHRYEHLVEQGSLAVVNQEGSVDLF